MTAGFQRRTVAIAGGGLAGLASGCALAGAGFEVTLYERRPYLGGRASSYEHPGTGEVVDNCQHVLLGCCTSLIDLYRRIGVQDKIRWYDRLTFIEPGGRRSEIGTTLLPPPLHTAPSFLRAPMVSLGDKVAITRAMLALIPRLPIDDGTNFLEWLKRHGQTERAIERFWKTILVSALNEDLDRMSVPTAALVFRESFLKSARAGHMGVPTVPLTDLYGRAGDYIIAHGGHVELRTSVDAINGKKLCINGREVVPDFAVLALPFDALQRVLPDIPGSGALRESLQKFETSPITGVHLWFDRQITELDHAVLLDRTIQWMFHKSQIQGLANRSATVEHKTDRSADVSAAVAQKSAPVSASGSYVELVISASKSLVGMSRSEIVDLAVRELAEFFPAVRDAHLIKATVIKEVHATFSPLPGSDAYRPKSQTSWPEVFLAGDWTATGWPATMEGAVRSGYLAAEAVCRAAGLERKFLAPDLSPSGFMRLFR